MLHFDQELATFKNTLLTMASHAESAVKRAVEALVTRNHDLALKVRADDDVIDRFEIDVDETAISLLSKAPLATDLRLIAAAMKISQNLERVGDEASKIANRARDLAQEPPLRLTIAIPQLAELALRMLAGSLDAFVHQDTAAARPLIPQDKQVDARNKEIHRQLADEMTAARGTTTRGP